MAFPIYTKRFVAKNVSASGSTDIWTVPSDGTYVIRDVILANLNATQQTIQLYVYTGSPQYLTILMGASLAQFVSAHFDCRQHVVAGDRLTVYSAGGGATILVTGYFFPQ